MATAAAQAHTKRLASLPPDDVLKLTKRLRLSEVRWWSPPLADGHCCCHCLQC